MDKQIVVSREYKAHRESHGKKRKKRESDEKGKGERKKKKKRKKEKRRSKKRCRDVDRGEKLEDRCDEGGHRPSPARKRTRLEETEVTGVLSHAAAERKKGNADLDLGGSPALIDLSPAEAARKAAKARSMVPMRPEEYQAQQSVVRQVFDEDTGRWRVVRGTGEIIERIVSKQEQQEIQAHASRWGWDYKGLATGRG